MKIDRPLLEQTLAEMKRDNTASLHDSMLIEWSDEDLAILSTIKSETDRGAAVILASFIEEELKILVRSRFKEVEGITDGLFGSYGPFGSSRAQADYAYLTDLIPKWFYKDLKFIRDIRNKFAHVSHNIGKKKGVELLTFESQIIIDLMANVKCCDPPPSYLTIDTLREKYEITCTLMIHYLKSAPNYAAVKEAISVLERVKVDEKGAITVKCLGSVEDAGE